MIKRNTIQKALISEAVRKLDHPTAEEIYTFVSSEHPSISKGTVYRNLGQMSEDGEILRICTPDGADHFDKTASYHYHFVCDSCRKVFDVDMPGLPELHVKNCRGEAMDVHEVVFAGKCAGCK